MKKIAFYASLILWIANAIALMDLILYPREGMVMYTALGITIVFSCFLVGTFIDLSYDD